MVSSDFQRPGWIVSFSVGSYAHVCTLREGHEQGMVLIQGMWLVPEGIKLQKHQ